MSASSTPTDSPRAASAAARFTVTVDLPTPPFPDATAYTLVSESGRANGMSLLGPPCSWSRRAVRCSSVITPSVSRRSVTPRTLAPRRSRPWSACRASGRPRWSAAPSGSTTPSAPTASASDHPQLGDGPADLGILDGGQHGADVFDSGDHASRLVRSARAPGRRRAAERHIGVVLPRYPATAVSAAGPNGRLAAGQCISHGSHTELCQHENACHQLGGGGPS